MNRRYRIFILTLSLVLLLAGVPAMAEQASLTRETSLWPAPGSGERSAFLTPDTPIEILESREGWVRVRIEGWVSADAVDRAATAATVRPPAKPGGVPPPPQSKPQSPPPPRPQLKPPPPPPPAPASTPPREVTPFVPPMAVPGGVVVEGMIKVKLGRFKKAAAAGAPVLLVPADVDLETAGVSPETTKRLAEVEAEAARIRKEQAKVMRRSNFTEATRMRDELDVELQEVLEQRQEILAERHGRTEHAARAAAVASGVADGKGFFRISTVGPGDYVLYVRMTRDDVDLEWMEPLSVGQGPVRVDLDESTARGMLPKLK